MLTFYDVSFKRYCLFSALYCRDLTNQLHYSCFLFVLSISDKQNIFNQYLIQYFFWQWVQFTLVVVTQLNVCRASIRAGFYPSHNLIKLLRHVFIFSLTTSNAFSKLWKSLKDPWWRTYVSIFCSLTSLQGNQKNRVQAFLPQVYFPE